MAKRTKIEGNLHVKYTVQQELLIYAIHSALFNSEPFHSHFSAYIAKSGTRLWDAQPRGARSPSICRVAWTTVAYRNLTMTLPFIVKVKAVPKDRIKIHANIC